METVQVLNRVGRDVTLTHVQSRQKVKQDNKVVEMPLHTVSYTLDKGKATTIPKVVWEANKNTSLVRAYTSGDNPKLQLVKSKSAKPAKQSIGVDDVVAAIETLIEKDEGKSDENLWTKDGLPELSALSELVGSKVSAKQRESALSQMEAK